MFLANNSHYYFMISKLRILFLITSLLAIPSFAVGVEDTQEKSIDKVLSEILSAQGIEQLSNVDCENITETQFEELGDALMSVMHPNQEQHELMDQMMGGEGSASLQAAHVYMGQSYLGCSRSNMGMGMMGSGMMGMMGMSPGMYPGWQSTAGIAKNLGAVPMMGFPVWGQGMMFVQWVTIGLIWTLLILCIVSLITYLKKKK